MVFLFAPHLHLAMKHVMRARRSIRTKTVFNLLGPLTNPLAASVQLLGVYDPSRAETIARASAAVGTKRAWVVAGHDGVDEISTSGPSQLTEALTDGIKTREVHPEEFGVRRAAVGDVRGGDRETNAQILRRVLEGDKGPCRDMVVVNASAALVAVGKAGGFLEGAELASETIDSGAAQHTLAALVEFTGRHRRH